MTFPQLHCNQRSTHARRLIQARVAVVPPQYRQNPTQTRRSHSHKCDLMALQHSLSEKFFCSSASERRQPDSAGLQCRKLEHCISDKIQSAASHSQRLLLTDCSLDNVVYKLHGGYIPTNVRREEPCGLLRTLAASNFLILQRGY